MYEKSSSIELPPISRVQEMGGSSTLVEEGFCLHKINNMANLKYENKGKKN